MTSQAFCKSVTLYRRQITYIEQAFSAGLRSRRWCQVRCDFME